MGNKKKQSVSEGLEAFKFRVDYVVNETPKYRSLVGTNEEFDEIPSLTTEAGDQEDAEKLGNMTPPAPSNDQPISMDAAGADVPEADPMAAQPALGAPADPMGDPMAAPDPGAMPPEADPMAAPPVEPENQVDDLQNEIIRHNIEAMKSIHNELAGMSDTFEAMNAKMDKLNSDVEEVREPTDSEKLMNKTDVSYPYYFNLNDFWQDNWFDQQRVGGEQEKGIKELPDGTYVADFDELPQQSKTDIDDSFNDI